MRTSQSETRDPKLDSLMVARFQGCCIALALAERDVSVTIFDRNSSLLSRAAVANEGKIHLGYMYGGDPSLRTARIMTQGALAFAPFLRDYLGVPLNGFELSDPAVYVVHRDSQRAPDEIEDYLVAVHSMVQEASEAGAGDYFGIDLTAPIRRWSAGEMDRELAPGETLAAFTSPEVAINPVALAALVKARIEATPNIEVRTEHLITSVNPEGRPEIVVISNGARQGERFDHVVNALWDGRITIDNKAGLGPTRSWIHRLKYGVSFRPPEGVSFTRSITIVLGPFGEVVRYGNGTVYLTWYPFCLHARTFEAEPPFWPILPTEPTRSTILNGTYRALAGILPELSVCTVDELKDVVVRGGPIVAWGKTDIDDPASELHRRFEIGVTSIENYHSVDPGKLTMAPYFAEECATRIAGKRERRPTIRSSQVEGPRL